MSKRNYRRKFQRKLNAIDYTKVDLPKIKRSLELEVEREKFRGLWGWLKGLFVSTRAERKLRLFKNMNPSIK